MNNEWTAIIKALRAEAELGLREASRKMGISAPYLQDLERGDRAPSRPAVERFIKAYKLDARAKRLMYDAVAKVNKCLPYDVEDYLIDNPSALQEIINKMNEEHLFMGGR